MNITEITVSAGRVVNHPYEDYSNLRPQVTLKATITDGEDATQATKALQSLAEQLVEDHKNAMLTSIRQLHRMAERDQEMTRLSQLITREQERLNILRAEVDSERSQLRLPGTSDEETINYPPPLDEKTTGCPQTLRTKTRTKTRTKITEDRFRRLSP